MSSRFVGRRSELRVLAGLVDRARRERLPTVGLVVGDPGAGKTRLLREVISNVDPGRVVALAGFETTVTIPFAALGGLVRRLAEVPEHGPRLEALVFGATDAGHGGLPVFEAAHRALARSGPIVVAIDDLQWVDAQSIALIHYALRAADSSGGPVTVIATSRPSPAASSFAEAIAGAVAEERRAEIDLGGLPLAEGLELIRNIDTAVDPRAGEEVWRRSHGSPFWLEALVRARGAADTATLIGERLRVLSEDAAAVLSVLVVAARPLGMADVAAVLGWPESRAVLASRELEARGLVTHGLDGTRPSHDLIRESAAREVPEARRRHLHETLAVHIEATAADDIRLLEEALDHRLQAGLPAGSLALRIVTAPGRRLLDVAALDRLQRVLDSLPPDDADQEPLAAQLARVAADLGQNERAIRLWDRVIGRTRDEELAAESALAAGRAAYFLARGAEVRGFLERARRLPLSPTAEISADSLEADLLLWLDHDTAAGRVLAERAVARGEQLIAAAGSIASLDAAAASAILHAVEAAGDAALQQDRGEDVLELAALSMALGERLGGEARIAALIRTAFGFRALRHLPEAERQYREALALARELVLPSLMAEAGLGVARVLRDLGRLDEARSVAEETLALENRIGIVSRRWGTSRTHLRVIEISLGVPGAFERLRSEAKTETDPHFAIGMHEQAAVILARQQGATALADVDAELEAARAASARAGCRRCGRELSIVGAELLARVGRVADARRELSTWEAGLVGTGYPGRDLWHERARIAIAAAEGRPGVATMLAGLAAAYERAGMLEEVIWTELDRGAELRRAGDRSGAIKALEHAASLAERIHAEGHRRRASRILRELGVRAWRRGAAAAGDDLSALSDREREIASMVAGGSSNREVAETLVLSLKTVERHVTNILAKVGARNRTELARLVHAGSVRDSPDE